MAGYFDQMNYTGIGGSGSYAPSAPVNAVMPTAQASQGVSDSFTPQMAGAGGQVTTPGMAGGMTTPQLTGWQKFGYVMDGIGAIGGLWGAIQQNKIAKQQLALSRDAFETNMRNSIQTYNTTLEDRIRARYAMEGRGSGEADAYLDENRLRRNA